MCFDVFSFAFGFLSCMALALVIVYSIHQFSGSDERPFNPNKPKR